MGIIKVPSPGESDKIANLHLQSLKDGLLYRLGKDVLKIFYNELFSDKDSFIFADYTNGKIAGIAASSLDIDRIFSNIKRKNIFKMAYRILLHSLKSPSIPFRLLLSKYSTNIKPELVFLFVNPKKRGKKIGEKLVKATSEEFKRRKIKEYKITILASNSQGINFYERLGFKKAGQYVFLGEKRDIYIYKIK